MKKSLVLALLTLAATSAKSFGQGILILQNYTITGAPYVTFGFDSPGTPGTPINSPGWTAGFYWAPGNIIASVPDDPTGEGIISSLLTQAIGLGSTATIDGATTFNTPGAFAATSSYTTAGVAGGGTITMEVVAYTGSGYASATYREHDNAFLVTVGNPTGAPTPVGMTMTPFVAPEPSVAALSGLGMAALMLIRRRQAAPVKTTN